MSFSVWLAVPICDACKRGGGQVWEWGGMTYNLVPMFRLAGFYDAMKGLAPRENDPKGIGHEVLFGDGPYKGVAPIASTLIPLLKHAVKDMEERPAVYRELEPPNKWGDYDGALKFTRALLEQCEKWPAATLEFSG